MYRVFVVEKVLDSQCSLVTQPLFFKFFVTLNNRDSSSFYFVINQIFKLSFQFKKLEKNVNFFIF